MFEKSTFGSREPDTTDKQIDALIDAAEGADAGVVTQSDSPIAAVVAVHQSTLRALVEVLRTSHDNVTMMEVPRRSAGVHGVHDPIETVDRVLNEVEAEYDSHTTPRIVRSELSRLTRALAEANLTIHGLYRVMRTKLGVSAADIATAVEEQRTGQPYREQPGVPTDDEIDAMEDAAAERAGTSAAVRGHRVRFQIVDHAQSVATEYSSEDELLGTLLDHALEAVGIISTPNEYNVRSYAGKLLDITSRMGDLDLGNGTVVVELKPATDEG